MRIGIEKTEDVVTGREKQNFNITTDNSAIKHIAEFKIWAWILFTKAWASSIRSEARANY